MADLHFSPSEIAVLDLLYEASYVIPAYQRPYSWGSLGKSAANDQVNQMWDDLLDAFENNPKEIYFFGSIVTIAIGHRKYEIVDGQQRLTTIILFFAAIRCFYKWAYETKKLEIGDATEPEVIAFIKEIETNLDEYIFNRVKVNDNSIRKTIEKKLRIEKMDTFDYDEILTKVVTCTPAPDWDAADLDDFWTKWKHNAEKREIAQRYFDNRDFFLTQLQTHFLDENGIFSSLMMNRLDKFFNFVTQNVFIVNIRANNIKIAYQVFEILNNRGLPLTSKDLFRNFLIRTLISLKEETGNETLDPIQQWQVLENNYQLDTDFISRYVESKLGKKQRYSAFNDIDEIYKKGFKDSLNERKEILFYKDIEQNLSIYTRVLTENLGNFYINTYVACILQAGNRAITVSLLLTLFRNETDKTVLLEFLKHYERYVLHLHIAARKRFDAPTIYEVMRYLNQKNTAAAIQKFILTPKELSELKIALDADDFKDNHIAKLFIMRYYWAMQEDETDTVYQELLYKNITLEHIIPQQPDENTNWQTDFDAEFREQFTYKLGNMTLLTKSKNSKANNFDWQKKRSVYKRTNLAMTLQLAQTTKMMPTDLENRQKHIVETLVNALGLNT